MFVVLKFSFDGDQYTIFTILEEAKEDFKQASEETPDEFFKVILMSVVEGQSFGCGAMGDMFGGEILEEWNEPDEGIEDEL